MNTPRYLRVLFATVAATTASSYAQTYFGDDSDNSQTIASSIGNGTLSAAWAGSRDVGNHLLRHRAGIRPGKSLPKPAPAPDAAAAPSAKSAKGPKVAAIVVPAPRRWEVFGSLFFYTEDFDGSVQRREVKKKKDKKGNYYDVANFITAPSDGTLDIYGGSLGIEYRIDDNWSAGIGVSASRGDLDLNVAGNIDIDSVSLVPYVSYYQQDALAGADLWAGLMYAYGMHSYDIQHNTGAGLATGSTDGDTHLIEANVGLNYGNESFVHGPYVGLRYITGSIDAYTEVGPGAVFFGEQDVDSFVSIVGYQASWRLRGTNGFWIPQLRVAWEHEFEDAGTTNFGLPLDSRDEDIAVLGAALGYWFDNGWRVGVEYEGRFGSDTTGHYGGVNVGKEF